MAVAVTVACDGIVLFENVGYDVIDFNYTRGGEEESQSQFPVVPDSERGVPAAALADEVGSDGVDDSVEDAMVEMVVEEVA